MAWQTRRCGISKEDPEQSVNFFTRIMGAPRDQNFITLGLNAGFTLKAPFENRDDDTAGLGIGYAKVSGRTADADADASFFSGVPNRVRHTETFVEATYQYQLFPWWQLQPDFQYVFDPGAGASNPTIPTQKIGNEAVIRLAHQHHVLKDDDHDKHKNPRPVASRRCPGA